MQEDRYKIEKTLGRYYGEYEARLFKRNGFWKISWWCHLKTVRDGHSEIARLARNWQKKFDIPEKMIIDLTVDRIFDYDI